MQISACRGLSVGPGGQQAAARGRAGFGASGATPGAAELFLRAVARQTPCTRAHLRVDAFAHGCTFPGSSDDGTYERVLRYPNGDERRIRYPLPPTPEEASSEDLTDGCWANTCWEFREQHWGGPPPRSGGGTATAERVRSAAASPPAAPSPADFMPRQPPLAEPESTPLPSSPMELLRFLTSPEHQQSQQQLWDNVRASYEVLSEVPWVAPKPLYLLATQQQQARQQQHQAAQQQAQQQAHGQPGAPAPGLTYCLRTRVARQDQEDELSRVLQRRAADGSPLIRCSEMRDGVVAFEDEADAERYGQMLEAEGSAEVSIARCNSHALFRSVQDVKAVVVLLRGGGSFLPQPHQLSTSLRSQPEAGGGGGEPLFD